MRWRRKEPRRLTSWYIKANGLVRLGYEHERGDWGWTLRLLHRGRLRGWVINFHRRKDARTSTIANWQLDFRWDYPEIG